MGELPPPASISDWPAPDSVRFQAAMRPDALAMIDLIRSRQFTYHDLDQAIDRCAYWLETQLSPTFGIRIAVLARNCAATPILHMAAARIGAVLVPLNWRLSVAELAFQVGDATPALLLADNEFLQVARDAARGTSTQIIELEIAEHDWSGHPAICPSFHPAAHLPSTILYTSGTSGRPKGALLSELNIFYTTVNFALMNRVSVGSVILCDMPLFHIVGLISMTRTAWSQGAIVVISAGFDPALTLSRLGDPALGITHYMCVPQMAQTLRQHPNYKAECLSHLTALCTGGAPNPPALIQRYLDDGVTMADGFGMSEAGTVLGMPIGSLDRIAQKAGSAGLPGPTMRIRLVDDDGNDVGTDEVGEIWISGPNLSPGYWNRPDLPSLHQQGGWLRSGDMARRDKDGFYFLVDRKKDMYISGGENVYPAEVEAAILELDTIAEVAVIGVANERWGEVGWAYVVPRAGVEVTAEGIDAHLATKLARYKRPVQVILVQSLPRTGSGKVQKHVLKSQVVAE
jgi:fatty-acyl-CoA synthase